jgi:hypothetical protein
MKERLLWILLLATILGLIWANSLHEVLSVESSSPVSSNFERTFTFDAQQGLFRSMHTLYVSVPASLYDYYSSESHSASDDGDYVKFVTSDAFKPIAEDIQNVTGNLAHSEEQFANAVLAVVRQVTYVKSTMKYPVEAIVENSGDCDVLSALAASIMKAGGLDVVLLYYKGLNPSHVNLGVYLPNPPAYHSIWTTPTGFEYNNKTYWMAEATSRGEWRVGDKPDLLAYARPTIIPLDNVAKPSPARVSSSLDTPLIPSSISASLFFDNSSSTGKEHLLTISGEISPLSSNKTVVMYINQDRYPFKTSTTFTDNDGKYVFTWNFTSTGTYHIRTSLGDFSDYAGSDSEKLTILISPYQPSIGVDNEIESDLGPFIASALPFYNRAAREIMTGNISGTGALLSGEFMILSNNQTTTPIIRQVIMPKITYVGIPRSRRVIAIMTGEEAIIEQTINNQLGFILRQNGEENFSASVRMVEDKDVSQVASQFDMDNAAFVNESQVLTEQNTWYKIEATISKNVTNAKLYEQNGTLLKDITAEENVTNGDQLGILMSYNPNAILAFRNLKVEPLDQPTHPASVTQEKANELEWLGSNIYLQTLIAVALATVSVASYVRRKRNEKKAT